MSSCLEGQLFYFNIFNLLVQLFLPSANIMENNFKNGSSETENNKELQAECEDPPYTKYLMNSKLRK